MLKKAFRLWLSAFLLAAGWSTALAAPSAPWTVDAVPCCHLAGQAGHAPGQGDRGCPKDAPGQMRSDPLDQDAAALLPASAGLTPPSATQFVAEWADQQASPKMMAAVHGGLIKPPERLFILHAHLLI
ncbi:hypothetical protein AAU61_20695 [Desulfocarbo indianensis]|nr:hypothetical protein AAU61_20695 [Desulfocarbo indianensis]